METEQSQNPLAVEYYSVPEDTIPWDIKELNLDLSIFDGQSDYEVGEAPVGGNHKYEPDFKVKVCAFYTVYQNAYKVAKLLGTYPNLINLWRKQSWWPIVRKEVQKAFNDRLDAKLTQVMDRATDELLDRVEKGNERVNHHGQRIRVKLDAKELADAGIRIPFDKRNEMRGEFAGMSQGKVNVNEFLDQLADKFSEIAARKRAIPIVNQQNVIDAEVIE